MSDATPRPEPGADAVYTAVDDVPAAFSQPCPVCGAPLRGGQRVACSEKCRAIRWRDRQDRARQDRDAMLRRLAEEILRTLTPREEAGMPTVTTTPANTGTPTTPSGPVPRIKPLIEALVATRGRTWPERRDAAEQLTAAIWCRASDRERRGLTRYVLMRLADA